MDSVLKQNMIKRDVLPALINNLQQIGLRSRDDLFLLFQFTVKYCKTHRIKLPSYQLLKAMRTWDQALF